MIKKLTHEELASLTLVDQNKYFLTLLEEEETQQPLTMGNLTSGSYFGLNSYSTHLEQHHDALKKLSKKVIQYNDLKKSTLLPYDGKDLRRIARKTVNAVININSFSVGQIRKTPILLKTSKYDIHTFNCSDGISLLDNPCRFMILLNVAETLKQSMPEPIIEAVKDTAPDTTQEAQEQAQEAITNEARINETPETNKPKNSRNPKG